MRSILCYGDSNTWGFDPVAGRRLRPDQRWPGVLRLRLGDGYRVVEEGLNGRTTLWDDPIEGAYKNGLAYLLPCLKSHKPLDLVVIMLGTNDLKGCFGVSASDIAQSAGRLTQTTLESGCGPAGDAPKVLLVAPPPLGPLGVGFAQMFEGGQAKSLRFSEQFGQARRPWGSVARQGGLCGRWARSHRPLGRSSLG